MSKWACLARPSWGPVFALPCVCPALMHVLYFAYMSAGILMTSSSMWDEVCSPKMQWWSLLALADLFVINRPHTLQCFSMRYVYTFVRITSAICYLRSTSWGSNYGHARVSRVHMQHCYFASMAPAAPPGKLRCCLRAAGAASRFCRQHVVSPSSSLLMTKNAIMLAEMAIFCPA